LVIGDTLLEEVGLAAEGDVLHEVKGIRGLVHFLVSESDQQTISDKFNVLLHQVGVHAEQSTGKSLGQELLLNGDGICDDVQDDLLASTVLEVGVKQASKVCVQSFVTRNELVGEGQTRHQTTLLEPEDGGECTAEEDALNSSECYQTLSESGLLVLNPANSPISLLANAGNWES
jgi:hypothetical protein